MRCITIALMSVVALGILGCPASAETQSRNAVTYQGTIYLSLDALLEAIGGTAELTKWARGIKITAGAKSWEYANGGNQLRDPSGRTRSLSHPVLVLNGKHFIPLRESAESFGYTVKTGSAPRLVLGRKSVAINARPIESAYQAHKVGKVIPIHEVVRTVRKLSVAKSLHAKSDIEALPKDTVLLLRRKVAIDGEDFVVATDCGPDPRSYLILHDYLRKNSTGSNLAGTPWARRLKWFRARADNESGLCFGNREKLKNSVAVTIDMCWSLRPFESSFFNWLEATAGRRRGGLPAVVFVSGRWIEQHPTEMDHLIKLSKKPGLNLVWGLHSWAHPKSGNFMNDFSRGDLREDTLRLERIMLEWGIVPTVYYRFPGLIHDRVRLAEIMSLDLLSIDCESWIVLLGRSHRYANPVQDGSIILVHGNGNEPKGIDAFNKWLKKHPNWEFKALPDFLHHD